VAIQTASGSSGAEMTIEGIKNPERLRDFLYQQMRGARDEQAHGAGATTAQAGPHGDDDALVLLREIRDELRYLRTRLARSDES
jgi:putative membrane protein